MLHKQQAVFTMLESELLLQLFTKTDSSYCEQILGCYLRVFPSKLEEQLRNNRSRTCSQLSFKGSDVTGHVLVCREPPTCFCNWTFLSINISGQVNWRTGLLPIFLPYCSILHDDTLELIQIKYLWEFNCPRK